MYGVCSWNLNFGLQLVWYMMYSKCCVAYKHLFCCVLLCDIVFWVLWIVMCLCSWRLCQCLCVWISWWFSYLWAVVGECCPSFFFSSLYSVWTWTVLCCICQFSFCRRFCGKLLFLAISCIDSHSFCFFFGVNGREYILEMWHLRAAILCSMGFGGLGVACWPLVPKFAGWNPAEAVGFLGAKKILSTPSFGREVKPWVPCRRFAACKRSLNVPWKSCI